MQTHEQIISDICEIAQSKHDPVKFKQLVELLYKKGLLDGNLQAIENMRKSA